MAYDGIFIKAQINEINEVILNEHIAKITQKSPKEVDFHVRKNSKNYIFNISVNPNFPYLLLSEFDIENTDVPPSFCMLLRKYLQSGTFKKMRQIGGKVRVGFDKNDYLERIVDIEIENISETGDICKYHLFIEIMGKYSNLIITDDKLVILDVLIKNTDDNARLKQKNKYNARDIANKNEILSDSFDEFMNIMKEAEALTVLNRENFDISNAICKNYAGISKSFMQNILKNCEIHEGIKWSEENKSIEYYSYIYNDLIQTIKELISNNTVLSPTINYKTEKPSDFYIYKLSNFEGECKTFNSINECLANYLKEKFVEISDSTEKKNIEEIIINLYSKLNKKLDIYNKDLNKCEDYEKYKNYAELVSAFGYNKDQIKDGVLTCEDYNNNNIMVSIPIDEDLSIPQNINKLYDKYNKLKRTKENATKLISECYEKIDHLNTIAESLKLSNDKKDIFLIKEELLNYFDETNKIQNLNNHKNLIKARNANSNKKSRINYNIHHYKSSNGVDIYVGKNNLQNEYLTFTMADSDDTWMHIKDATGSHVIVKKPYISLDDKTLVEAASLAAYFSEKKNETKATVDYTLRKELKKVKGKAPGFCIYHKNYSINVKPEITIKEI